MSKFAFFHKSGALTCDFFLYCGNSFLNGIIGRIYNIRFIYSQIAKLLPHGFYQFDICLSV